MNQGLELDFDAIGIERVALELASTIHQVDKALASTLRKMALWLRVQSLKGLSKELQIQQKIIRRRLRSLKLKRTLDGQSITVWYGLDPISYIYLGTPRKTATGVRVGNFDIPGGFVAKGRNGKLIVFKRVGKSRLPLAKQSLDIKDQSETYIADKLLGSVLFEAQLLKIFEHELKWQTRTKG